MSIVNDLKVEKVKPSKEQIAEWLKNPIKYEEFLKEYTKEFFTEIEKAKMNFIEETTREI